MKHHLNFVAMGVVVAIAASLSPQTLSAQGGKPHMSMRQLYKVAVIERGDAINIAISTADKILIDKPGDALANAYKGSLFTMLGGDAFMPWTKLRYANSGLDMMDAAADASRNLESNSLDQAEVLLVCGLTNSRLPPMFKRAAVARSQITALIDHQAFSALDDETQAQALALASVFAKSDGDAQKSESLKMLAEAKNASIARQVYDGRF